MTKRYTQVPIGRGETYMHCDREIWIESEILRSSKLRIGGVFGEMYKYDLLWAILFPGSVHEAIDLRLRTALSFRQTLVP
jgi:hypothetical protein